MPIRHLRSLNEDPQNMFIILNILHKEDKGKCYVGEKRGQEN
jgi:hypothetical protein